MATVLTFTDTHVLPKCPGHSSPNIPFTCNVFAGTDTDHCQLKLVNFEAHDNHAAHKTEGLSKKHLVVRRGSPFKIQLLFGQGWNPHAQVVLLEVWLGIKNKMSYSYK